MGDFAKCKECYSIFEKKDFNKLLGKYSKGIIGKEKYCSEECRLKSIEKGASGNLISR